MKDEVESLKQKSQQPDLETKRDRYLSKLHVGKQAPEYKRKKATIDQFIKEVRQE